MYHPSVLQAAGLPAGVLLDPTTDRLLAASLPTGNDLHVSQVLSNISVAYRNQSHIWRDVMPVVGVPRIKDSVRTFNQGDWLRNQADLRTDSDRGPRGGYRVGTTTYECLEYSMSTDITDRERDLASIVDDPDADATDFCSDQVNLKMEKLVAASVFTAGNYASGNTATLSGTDQWSDGTSDPIGKIRDAKETVSAKIGFEPNTLVIGMAVWRQLQDHPDIVERFFHTQTGIIKPNMVSDLFEVDRLLVGASIEATSAEGVSTVTTARIWGKQAALLYLPTGAQLKNPAFGYTFVHQDTDFITETWRNGNGATSDAVRTRIASVPVVLANQAGYLYSDVVA